MSSNIEGGTMKHSEQEIAQQLLTVDEEFRKLHQQHQEMERTLAEFDGKHYLSPSEEIEVKRLKKQKLLRKDEMYRKIYQYKRNIEV